MIAFNANHILFFSGIIIIVLLYRNNNVRNNTSIIEDKESKNCLVFTCRRRDPNYMHHIHTNMVHGYCMEADFKILTSEMNGKNLTNDHFCVAEVLYRLIKTKEYDEVIFRDLDTRFNVRKMISKIQNSEHSIVGAFNRFHTNKKQNVVTNLLGFNLKKVDSEKIKKWLKEAFGNSNSDQAPFNKIFICGKDMQCVPKNDFGVEEVHCRSRMKHKRKICMEYGHLSEHGDM